MNDLEKLRALLLVARDLAWTLRADAYARCMDTHTGAHPCHDPAYLAARDLHIKRVEVCDALLVALDKVRA